MVAALLIRRSLLPVQASTDGLPSGDRVADGESAAERGEFLVVKELLKRLGEGGRKFKAEVDCCIDCCDHMQNLRVAIAVKVRYKHDRNSLCVSLFVSISLSVGNCTEMCGWDGLALLGFCRPRKLPRVGSVLQK